jgi:hypothetical protein
MIDSRPASNYKYIWSHLKSVENGERMRYSRGTIPYVLYLLLASIAASIFFGTLVFLNSLGITIHYYRASVLETTFLSRQLDLYALWFSTLVVFFAITGLTMTYSQGEPIACLPISVLGVGMVLLTCGLVALAAFLILVGQVLALMTKIIYQAGSHIFFSKKRIRALLVVYLLSLVLLIELPALIYWVAATFWPGNMLGRGVALLETNLAYATSSISPWLYAAFLFGWLWAPAVVFLRKKVLSKNRGRVVKSDTSTTASIGVDAGKPWSKVLPVLFLLGLSVFVGYYPYWHEPEWLVGTDVYWIYKNPLDRMAAMSGPTGFEQALNEHQSMFLILLLGLMRITGFSSHQVLRYTPMILTVMTSIATFWLVNKLRLGRDVSLLSSIASIMWVPTTIGIFTSLLANWFAVVFWIIFLAVLMKKDSKFHIVGAAALGSLFSLAILFIHPWSWGPFAATTSLYLLAQLIGRRLSNRKLTLCAAFDLAGLAVGYMSLLMLKTSPRAFITDALSYYIAPLQDPRSILAFPDAINYFATLWSPFLNPVLVVVAIAGILAIVDRDDGLRHLMWSWLCVTSIASILATSLGYWGGGFLWRVFFVAPVAVLTALGASQMCRTLEQKIGGDNRVRGASAQWLWTVLVLISTLGASVTSVMMSGVFPELGLFLSLVLNLLLVTLLFHWAYEGVGISYILGVTIAVLIANSGLRSLMPLLVDPHNISLG